MTTRFQTLLLFAVVYCFVSLSSFAQESDYQLKCQSIIDSKGKAVDSVRLHELFDISWNRTIEHFPEWGSRLGYPNCAHRWTDNSFEAIAVRSSETRLNRKVLASIDRDRLSADDRLNYDLFRWTLDDRIARQKFPNDLLPVNQMGGPHQNVATTLMEMPTDKLSQCEDIISRLKHVDDLFAQTVALMQEGVKRGVTPPRHTLRELPAQIDNQIVSDPKKSPMLTFLGSLGSDIPDADRTRIEDDAVAIYTSEIFPALKQFRAFVVDTYLPACQETIGLSNLPNGRAWYNAEVRHYTTTDMSADEIFELGQAEVKRIRGVMEQLIDSVGFEGTFDDFCGFLETDPRFYYTEPDAVLTAYRDICKRIDPQLVRYFGHLPRLPYGVEPVPDFAAMSQTIAYYDGGSLASGQPGIYRVNTYDLRSHPTYEMAALTLHEAVPGHHLQIAIAQELEDLPEFRRYGWFTSYGEGWALYAESLGDEMGLYDDPYDKFGQLSYEMWRALRLVVDAGMHARGWTREQAIALFEENLCSSLHDIEVEIDRYIVWPGQALAYKIGELKIKELRKRAHDKLGDDFDLRAFHDLILGSGTVPMAVLESRVDDWIAGQLSKS